ncbi:MAG TPA: NAD(P)-binding protein [Thermomicrobiales bacterium]|jgi:thioredoxin reductase|nr:NAD(P)-binding protein [Thermomicrobiales bacterium]
MATPSHLPVAIIGAGPVGLAAAAHLLAQGQDPVILEQGAEVGAGIRSWGHVRLFSPWQYVVDEAAAVLLTEQGWTRPTDDGHPTGHDFLDQYHVPLAAVPAIASRLRLGSRVIGVTRSGFDKMKSFGREDAPFRVDLERADGTTDSLLARAVVDASGTILSPNPIGASGRPVPGEAAAAGHIAYGVPDILGAARERYAGRRVLVIGSGHSAFNALLDLARLGNEASATTVTWAVRRPAARFAGLFGGGAADGLAERGALGSRTRDLVENGSVQLVAGFRATRVTQGTEGLTIAGDDTVIGPVDEVIVATGFRPDLSLLSELRVALDPVVESPVALAPLIDPNVHSCGSVPPHGAEELRHPEPDLYIAGMKSYGRAPTFLMLTGYEQVRSIACAIAGDWAAAREVRLVLPETGVCSTSLVDAPGASCCGATIEDVAAATGMSSCCGGGPAREADTSASSSCCGGATTSPQVIQLTPRRRFPATIGD